ncbi:protein-glutamate methylesterase/protein-glutamine glutaminase [Desulfotalea psychrophila]|uniref:Protein-glutamate methylesterase/protein-glutamine glutaminase n=1 Tax=Desulfotalea psychrophila (strain LSv54 / DSM 12343) TaxID=177439 RepID=CHEB_DESPS|nr:chemotaxis response regulator protein-glutamate methylesterase [Desulfotalea psychrophila]Q6AJV3.1 RecName: Full=Protein-glutamate methylesterase/protein-glutamine glutaminase [Desulfotalea psychrophila LSv54]CAG37373.1 related to two-component system response regulator (Che family) [Desulfotalea psychrophila LSv54]
MKNLRVLVVDDTILYRKIVSDLLREIPGIEVIGVAHNGKIALDKIRLSKPDLITLDIEMPVMNGIELLEHLKDIPDAPGAVMLSTLTSDGSRMTMKALELGAFDFILKPQEKTPAANKAALANSLKQIVKTYRLRNIGFSRTRATTPASRLSPRTTIKREIKTTDRSIKKGKAEIVVIGISTGGPNALTNMLPQIPGNIGVPILIVQHMPPVFTASLATSLNKKCQIEVKEAEDGEAIQPGIAYIAPGGKQMKISASKNGVERLIKITNDPPENSCRPSVDYLFRSVGDYFIGRATAVIMTGMGADGTKGLEVLMAKGAHSIGQDEESCVVYGMPKSVADAGLIDTVCPLNKIAQEIVHTVKLY